MRYFELVIPCADNAGLSTAYNCQELEKFILDAAGGFTVSNTAHCATGVWRDASGKVYRESVMTYRIACDADTFAQIVAKAFDLFPDQAALFHALIGEATIADRPVYPTRTYDFSSRPKRRHGPELLSLGALSHCD